MKKLYLFTLLVFISTQLFGQEDQSLAPKKSPYIQKMDSIFEDLDKTKIETGILYDRVPSFANIEKFNKENDTANFNLFRQAWSELYRASYTPEFENLPEKINSIKMKDDYDQVSLGLINMEFNSINKGEGQKEKGFQMRNGKLASVEGKDLYKKERLVMLSPLKDRVWGENITYKFNEDFWLQETGQAIENLSVDFGDSNWQIVIKGGQKTLSEFSINYDESGIKLLRFQVTMQNGAQYTTQSTINVQQTSSARADPLVEDNNIKANIAFKGYDESVAIKGKNEYRTFYRTKDGNTTTSLQKPIIILDGFDPLDERKIDENDEGHEAPKSILQLMEYGSEDNNLVTTLRDEGYDVIIVNHSSYEADETGETIVAGGDFIERNARVLIALIQRVNEELERNGSTEDLVVVGPSMGGLISRYALAYMEKNNMDHNTDLWVSFDSPHLGANIPIAIQQSLHFLAYSGGNEDSWNTFENVLNSNAAKQMLIEQFGSMNNTAPFRQQFESNLTTNGLAGSNGFPVNLRKVSLLNGTTLGKRNNEYGEQFLNVEGKLLGVRLAEVITNFLDRSNVKIRTFKGIISETSFSPTPLTITFKSTETTNSNPHGSMDVTAGAYHDTGQTMFDKLDQGFNDAGLNVNWRKPHIPNHTFIPTVSALALENPNYNWSNTLNRNLVCTGETPFDSYYAPENNQQHITPTAENVDWIMEEINGNEQEPVVRLPGLDLKGPQIICDNEDVTYYFESCKRSGVPNWSVSQNLQIIQNNDNSVTVRKSGRSFGDEYITADFGFHEVTRKVHVGKPDLDFNFDVNGPENAVYGAMYNFSVDPIQGATSYQWELPAGWSIPQGNPNSSFITVRIGEDCGLKNIRVKPINICDPTGLQNGSLNLYVNVTGCPGSGPACPEEPCIVPHPLNLAPNPNNGTFSLDITSLADIEPSEEYLLKIYSPYNELVYERTHRQKRVQFNLRNLDTGIHQIILEYRGYIVSERMLIE